MRNKAQEWVPFNGWHQDREYGFQIAKYGLGEESAKLSKKNNMIHIFFLLGRMHQTLEETEIKYFRI